MAYMSQEKKAQLAPQIKAVLKKWDIKGTIGVKHHSTLVVNIKSGPIDFFALFDSPYAEEIKLSGNHSFAPFQIRCYKGEANEFLKELSEAMMVGNFDKSDSQSDYFHVGWYADINIGRWDKKYEVTS